MDIREEARRRILILDGAMGTMIQRAGIVGNNEQLNLSRPELIEDIHRQYVAAGADIITTNTFGANTICQEEYGLAEKARHMALEGARIARRAADSAGRKVWVAGDLGPTGKSLSLASDIAEPAFRKYSFDQMAQSYREQISALVEGGVDLLLLETCFDALNAKAAIYAMESLGVELPVMLSVSIADRSGRTLTGQTLEAFYRSTEHARLLSFGLNCSLGAEALKPFLQEASDFASCLLSCHPNAGLPNEMGIYSDRPVQMAREMAAMASEGLLNIAGGCCGTTPDHIEAIAKALKGISPRAVPESDNALHVSGLEPVLIDRKRSNFTNIGERTNVAGSRKFARLIASGEYDAALEVAAGQIEGGAGIIDINMDDAMLDSAKEMRTFLRHIANDPAVAKAAIMIDSSHWETILEGLKNAQGKSIVNSISLKEGEEEFLAKAREIRRLGAAVVVMAFDEEGQATTYERKTSICARAYKLLMEKAGFSAHDIIFDVNVLSIGTGIAEHAKYGVDFIEAVRWIKSNLPGALTSGGISNLSFAFRGNNPVREAMHSAFLYHAGLAGLDMGIVNPGMLQIYDEIEKDMLERVEDVLFDRTANATERLAEKAGAVLEALNAAKEGKTLGAKASDSGNSATEPVSAAERIVASLVKGSSESLKGAVMESLSELGSAVAVIEGPLMEGMTRVGALFGEGRMFLPQVVKSAKAMRDAVAVLEPYMNEDDSQNLHQKPKAVIATVKGDVHDIGKNITATVLRCNGFEVTDLGVMVPKEDILSKAEEIGADIIAVSGLITPSLFQMEELCREMASRGLETPLFIGGATASPLHTAVKLAPLYGHVFYGSDASTSAVMAKRCMMDRQGFEDEEHARQESLRRLYKSDKASKAETKTGRKALREPLTGRIFSDIPVCELSICQLLPYFDWSMFYLVWGSKEDPSLRREAESLMERMEKEGGTHIRMGLRFADCHCEDDTLVLDGLRLPMLRQEEGKCLSLSDFFADKESGKSSQLGFFAASVVSPSLSEACGDYGQMMQRAVDVTLVEAVSSWVDEMLKKQLPHGLDARIVKPAAGYASCPDHTLKREIMEMIPDSASLGISFTESFAMAPDAAICALVLAHPDASYPDIRKISRNQIDAYALRRGMSEEQKSVFLSHLLK